MSSSKEEGKEKEQMTRIKRMGGKEKRKQYYNIQRSGTKMGVKIITGVRKGFSREQKTLNFSTVKGLKGIQ